MSDFLFFKGGFMSITIFYKRHQRTVTALTVAAAFLISLFHSNATAQSILPEQEVKQPTEVLANLDIQVNTDLSSLGTNPERDYVLNIKKMNKAVFCLAQNAFFESGGESFKSKLAVSQVVKNRSETEGFPDTECGVVKQMTVKANVRTCQFSWWCAGKREIPLYDKHGELRPKIYQQWYDSVKAALMVYNDKAGQIVEGATHFYSHRQVRPAWTKNMKVVEVIDNQTFVKPK
jgi:spore germination cell wall hydrolase CwlJ-like protein